MNWAPFGAMPFGGAETMLAPPAAAVVEPPPPSDLAPDILTAAWSTLAADAGLEAMAGRPALGNEDAAGWLFRPGRRPIPFGTPNPLVALAWVSGTASYSSSSTTDESLPYSGDDELQVSVWADTREQAANLGTRIAAVLRAARKAGSLQYAQGEVTGIWWLNPDEAPEREEDPGPQEQDVFLKLLRFRVRTNGLLV